MRYTANLLTSFLPMTRLHNTLCGRACSFESNGDRTANLWDSPQQITTVWEATLVQTLKIIKVSLRHHLIDFSGVQKLK